MPAGKDKSPFLRNLTWALVFTIVLALAATPGVYAWWSSSVKASTAGKVTAGNFAVSLINNSGQSVQMPGTLSLGSSEPLFPGKSTYAKLSIRHDGNVSDSRGALLAKMSSQPYTEDTAAIRQYVQIFTSTNRGANEDCSAVPDDNWVNLGVIATNKTTPLASRVATVRLYQGQTVHNCFKMTLAKDAPSSVQGQQVMVNIPVVADQNR